MARPPGEKVCFYHGMMHRQDRSGKCVVVFADSKDKQTKIRESDVLLIEKLDIGQELYVRAENTNDYQQGKYLRLLIGIFEYGKLIVFQVPFFRYARLMMNVDIM